MALAAERAFDDFGLVEIAERAGVTLAEFRDAFPSKGAVLAGFSRRMDHAVLSASHADMAGESDKDRIFDVLMKRLDAMAPYREAMQGVLEWARRNPASATALNGVALNSMRFMLAAAGIEAEGNVGAAKLQGLVLAWTRIVDVWVNDDEPGLARTMAALDRELDRGKQLVARLEDLDRLASPLRSLGRAMFQQRRRFADDPSEPRTRRGPAVDPREADGDRWPERPLA